MSKEIEKPQIKPAEQPQAADPKTNATELSEESLENVAGGSIHGSWDVMQQKKSVI